MSKTYIYDCEFYSAEKCEKRDCKGKGFYYCDSCSHGKVCTKRTPKVPGCERLVKKIERFITDYRDHAADRENLVKLLREYQDVAEQIMDAWQDIGGCDEYKFGDNCSELCPFRYPRDAIRNDFGCHKAALSELSRRTDEVCDE